METFWASAIEKECLQSHYQTVGTIISLIKTHKCVFILMQIALLILRAINPHEVMFVYQKMELLVAVAKNDTSIVML